MSIRSQITRAWWARFRTWPRRRQLEYLRRRDEKRVAKALARGKTFVGVKGHQHSPEVLDKKRKAMKRLWARSPATLYQARVKAAAKRRGISEDLEWMWLAMKMAVAPSFAAARGWRTRKARRRQMQTVHVPRHVPARKITREDNLELLALISRMCDR